MIVDTDVLIWYLKGMKKQFQVFLTGLLRVGYWDFGVNIKRIEQIRNRLKSIHNGVSE